MAFRTAGVFKVASTNTPQPMFGSWITAWGAGAATGAIPPLGAPTQLTLGTAQNAGNDATQILSPGEDAWLIEPGGGNAETVHISNAAFSGNIITLSPQTRTASGGQQSVVTQYSHTAGAFGTGTFIMPKQLANNFLIDLEDGGTGSFLYLGNRYNMTSVLWRFFKLAKVSAGVQPSYYSTGMYSAGNSFDISELWVYGTAGDLWNMSIEVN